MPIETLKMEVEVDDFVASLPVKQRRILIRAGLTSEAAIRQSFASDGGLAIVALDGFGPGALDDLRHWMAHGIPKNALARLKVI